MGKKKKQSGSSKPEAEIEEPSSSHQLVDSDGFQSVSKKNKKLPKPLINEGEITVPKIQQKQTNQPQQRASNPEPPHTSTQKDDDFQAFQKKGKKKQNPSKSDNSNIEVEQKPPVKKNISSQSIVTNKPPPQQSAWGQPAGSNLQQPTAASQIQSSPWNQFTNPKITALPPNEKSKPIGDNKKISIGGHQKVAGKQSQKPEESEVPQQQSTQRQATTEQQIQKQSSINLEPISHQLPMQKQTTPVPQPTPRQQSTTPAPQQSPRHQQAASNPQQYGSNGNTRKSKGGFQPLEVVPGSCVGARGTKLTIDVNYLRINLERLVPKAYHYDIRFEPEKIPKKHLHDIVEKFRQNHFPKYFLAYDGQNSIYSTNILPIPTNVFKEEMLWHDNQTNRDRTIIIALKEVDSFEIDLTTIKKYVNKTPGVIKPLRAIQCLEIVLRMPYAGKFVNVNRSFYCPPNRLIDLGENYELWTGLYQSVVLGDVSLFNVDVVNKPFPSARHVLDLLRDLLKANVNQPLSPYVTEELNNYLKGLSLVYKQPGTNSYNVYKFNGCKGPANTQTFMLENKKMTVENYFKEKNIPLRYAHLPCLWCGPTIKNIYLPLEHCQIQEGQVIKKKLSENQVRTVIAETATSTDTRKSRIMDLLNKIRHNDSKVVQQFGVNIGDKFTEVEARILAAPTLEYLSNTQVRVERGVWNAEREKFLDGKQCTNWSVLKLDERCDNSVIFKFSDMISEIGRKANMSFAPKFTDLIEMRSNSRKHEIEEKMQNLKKKNVELLFVIIPNRNEAYPNVKQAAELKCGILTQCIKSFTLTRKLTGSTVYNILLKLNSKLNGLNHKVIISNIPPVARGKLMIVGADVTHPTGTMNEPSAVGVAASHDINALKYNMCWRIQNPTQEMITDLKNIMVEQLNYYKKCMNNDLPDKILYYRDGVSDGQFEEVLNIELAAIYLACQQIQPNYKPLVTFIVVQKRHNTRFYPGASRMFCGKNNNVMPGTIVDKFIIDPRQYQFFLVSHAAIQGVAKPTKYCVIWDDSKIKADELQALTYNLCHVFTRCNRAVSYVAPTYYAHLAAYRGKVYIQNERLNMNNLDQEFRQRQIREEISKGHPMFFV